MKKLLGILMILGTFAFVLSACGRSYDAVLSYDDAYYADYSDYVYIGGDYVYMDDNYAVYEPLAIVPEQYYEEYEECDIDWDSIYGSTVIGAITVSRTFEQSLQNFATDVVVAHYVGSRPFGQTLTEFEFIVLDRVLGNAPDRVFVYAETRRLPNVYSSSMLVDLTFNHGTNYLLPLNRIGLAHTNTHEDGYTFIGSVGIVIDLDNPHNSVRGTEPLALHSQLNFNARGLTGADIVSYVEDLTRYNPPGRDFIRSSNIEDIIHGSPYVLIIDVNRPLRLSSEQFITCWMLTDIYYFTVVRALKGDPVNPQAIVFNADAVSSGERHIVAVKPNREGGTWYDFTSRYSLFPMEQLDEIVAILNQQ